MPFKLILYAKGFDALLPFSYQHPLSAAIYKIIKHADETFAIACTTMVVYRQTISAEREMLVFILRFAFVIYPAAASLLLTIGQIVYNSITLFKS